MKSRCKDCGANVKPSCSSCSFTSGDINQQWVEQECRESQRVYQNSYCYRKNKYLKGCLLSYNDKMFDEGSW